MRYIKPNLNTCLLLKFFSLVLIILPSSLLSEVFENLQNRRHYVGTYFQVASYFYEEPNVMNKESQLPFLGVGQIGTCIIECWLCSIIIIARQSMSNFSQGI